MMWLFIFFMRDIQVVLLNNIGMLVYKLQNTQSNTTQCLLLELTFQITN
jgi:hypothetical protein